jgi:hypothetical protein
VEIKDENSLNKRISFFFIFLATFLSARQVAEKRGWHWSLTSFTMNSWGQTEKM